MFWSINKNVKVLIVMTAQTLNLKTFFVRRVCTLKISHKQHSPSAKSLEHFKEKQALRNKGFFFRN